MIVIKEYDPSWPAQFESIKASLAEVLGTLALRIDHIGSTSVPGLGAKDVIDIQITVRELSPLIKQKMISAGYIFREPLTSDHVPLGEDAAAHLWVKQVFVEPPGVRRMNIHVRLEGNPNQQYPLLFRDYLRAHPNSSRSVERIKRELAKRHAEDVEAYYDVKDPAYDLIWDAAQDWARVSGWQPR